MGGGVENKQYKNKGFTLAELLAVIVILGIIALIVFPAVNKSIKSSKEKTYNQQVESILRSARNWGLENISNLREERTNYVTIDELKQSGYLEAKNVVNPMTEEEMNGCIVIKYNSAYNQYEYSYNETSCSELNTLPVITLTGESTITIGIGETYNELGATASFEDINVSSSITITDNIDNSKEGTYQVRYNVTYDGIEAKEVVRTVKVIDKSPVITLKGESNITIKLNQIYTDEGATAKTYTGTDISSSIVVTSDVDTTKAGTYTVRYNVTYDGKSAEEVTRTVTVVDKNSVITLNQTGTTGYEQSVTINVTVTLYGDNTISSIKYKLNGGSEQTVNNNQIVIDTTGEHQLEIIVTDSEGNVTTLTSGPYYIDADKPTMTLEVSDDQINDSGWSNEDIIINVTPTDIGGSDIKEYLYCYGNDCTPSITGTGNTITISDEGEDNYVCALAIDNAGNESEKVCVGPYKIDKTIEEPTIESTTQANSNGWYKEDIGINLTTRTDSSGINSIKYCKTSTSTTCTPDTSISGISGSITIDIESATNYICALSIDKAGNESATKCTGPYALDKTAPTLTVPAAATIKVTEVTSYDLLTEVSATDDVSDIDGSVTTSGDFRAEVGEYEITYTATDKAGNSISDTRVITVVEAEGPIVSLSMLNTNNEYAGIQSIAITANDASGVKSLSYQITKDGTALDTVNVTVDGSNHAEDTIELSESGIYSIHVIATDAYNSETVLDSGEYKIDAEDPTISLAVSGSPFNASGWAKVNITLNVTTGDTGGSSVSSYKYCYGNNCTPNTTGSGSTIIISTESATNYVCAISIDGAGNESEKACVGPYALDKTISQPTIAATTSANSNGWYKANIGFNLTTSTDTSGISSIKYCKTSSSTTCTPNTAITGSSGTVTIDTESAANYICALSIDNAGNQSASKCSGPYKLDKTAPTLTVPAAATIKVSEVASYNLLTVASASDGLSQLDGSITTSGSLSTTVGTYTITYSVKDKAGNTATKTRKITVTYPSISEVMSSSSQVASLDPDGNLRYVGANPNNYVSFNEELWRIIGVFDGQAKIIRNEYYSTSIKWDSDYNNWAEADLQAALNGTYLTSIQTNDPTSYSYIDLTHVWNIGGAAKSSTSTWTRASMYSLERGLTTAGASGSQATWTGAIGLMYPSDYGYSTSGAASKCDTTMRDWDSYSMCYGNSWLYDSSQYQWTLTPLSDDTNYVFLVYTNGYVDDHYVRPSFAARPVLYLKSDVGIVDGKGTDQEPYQLSQ